MWWVETKEGIAPGQWGKGRIWLQRARGWGGGGEGDTRGVILFRPEAQEARHLPSTPSLREQSCQV